MKRGLTLAGFITSTVIFAIFTLATVYMSVNVLMIEFYWDFLISYLFVIAFMVTTLTLNAVSIGKANQPHEKYVKGYGVMITAVVFNFIFLLILLFSMDNAFLGMMGVVTTLFILAILMTNIFAIVDMARETGRISARANTQVAASQIVIVKEEQTQPQNAEISQPQNNEIEQQKTEETKSEDNTTQSGQPFNDFNRKVRLLDRKLEEGIITQEQYKELRKIYIEKELNN